MTDIEKCKEFLTSDFLIQTNSHDTDQGKEIKEPPIQKPCPTDAKIIDLLSPKDFNFKTLDFLSIMQNRKSRRNYLKEPITLSELSYLLWCTQGVKKVVKNGYATLRTVPSAGARHSFETYIAALNVESIDPGIYRYLPLDHKLVLTKEVSDLPEKLAEVTLGQNFVKEAALMFLWTTVPYRMSWRYGLGAYKNILLDAGHLCQNLYLAAESINLGTCALAAYDQEKTDELLQVDGKEELAIYLASLGRNAGNPNL